MSKVKKLKEIKSIDSILNLEAAHVEVPWAQPPELRYLVKREPTFWKKGIKVLQYFNGVEWVDVPKVRTV